MLLTSPSLSSESHVYLKVRSAEEKEALSKQAEDGGIVNYVAAPEGYSDAIRRSDFCKTSFHVPGKNISVQVSNKPYPNETTEDDWVDITSTMTGYVCTDYLFQWCRVKGVEAGDVIYIVSIRYY